MVRRQGPVANPNAVVWGPANGGELRGLFASGVPEACFARVELHSCVGPHGLSNRVMQLLHALRQRDDVDVVQECKNRLAIPQKALNPVQRRLDCQGEQGGHEGVALFPALRLPHLVSRA